MRNKTYFALCDFLPHSVEYLKVGLPPKIRFLFSLLLLGALLPKTGNAQNLPDCSFSVMADGLGTVTASLTPPTNGCPNVIDWGDGCTNNNTNSLVKHRYSSCGAFTVTHTVRWNACFETAACTRTVNVVMAAAHIKPTLVEENSDCGVIEKLQATIARASGC